MDKYLQEILKAHLSVILPEFGALSFEENSHKAVFNPYVTYNDGKFQGFLVEKHRMDPQEASNMVAQYVKEIQNHVNKGESFVIFQFGRFLKLDDGSVDFQNWEDFNPKGAEQPKESKKNENEIPETEKVESIELTTEVNEKNAEPVTVEPAQAQKIEGTEEISSKKVKKEPAKKAEKPQKTPKPAKEPKEKKKRGAFFYINIVLFLFVLSGASLVVVYYDQVQSFLGLKKTEKKKPSAVQEEFAEITKAKQTEDAPIEESESASDTNQTEIVAETVKTSEPEMHTESVTKPKQEEKTENSSQQMTSASSGASGAYHLIGGSFGDPTNAERFAQTLQGKGLPAQVLEKTGKLSLVSVQSFSTLEEAKSAISRVAEQAGAKLWIYKQNE